MRLQRRMQRQAGFAQRKIADAVAFAAYREAEARAGRVPMDKRTWRAKRPDIARSE